MYETIQDVDGVEKRLMQTWFDFDQVGLYRSLQQLTVWDHCVHAGGRHLNTRSEINVHLHDLSERFVKLSM